MMLRLKFLAACCLLGTLLLAIPAGAQGGGPSVVTRIPVDDCVRDVLVASSKVVFQDCETVGPVSVSIASPAAEGDPWTVQADVDDQARFGLAAVRSSVAYPVGSGGLRVMNVSGSDPSFDDVSIPTSGYVQEALGYAMSAGLSAEGRERFVAPVSTISLEGEMAGYLAVVTKQPDGPPGPNGPTPGGWGLDLIVLEEEFSNVVATALMDEVVYVASQSEILEIDLGDLGQPELAQTLVFSQSPFDEPIVGLFGDGLNGRVLVQRGVAPNLATPVAQEDSGSRPVEPSTDPLVRFVAPGQHLQVRSESDSVLFGSAFEAVTVVDVGDDGSSSIVPAIPGEGLFFPAIGGAGETLAVVERDSTDAEPTYTVVVYDLTGWVPPIQIEAMPVPLVGGVSYVPAVDGDPPAPEPWCTVNVDSLAGYCFTTTTDRQTYITDQLLENSQYGTIWIGRSDEEVVAP